MRRTTPFSLALFLAAGCSALVQIDDEKYLGGTVSIGDGDGDVAPGDGDGDLGGTGGDGDGDGDTGGSGDGDGDGDTGGSGDGDGDVPTGGLGGAPAGGSGGGGTGGGSGGGSGGTPITIPDPVHYFPLDGNTDDLGTGSPQPATVTAGVTWHPTTGLTGGALEIPLLGDEYLNLGSVVASTSPFTLSWWFIQSESGFITLASRFPGQQTGESWELIADTGRPRLKIGGTEYNFEFQFPDWQEGKWVHIVFAYEEMFSGSNDHFKVWVDNTLVLDHTQVLTSSALAPGAEIRIGQGGGGTNAFSGFLDEIRVYNAFLSDETVEALYLYDLE